MENVCQDNYATWFQKIVQQCFEVDFLNLGRWRCAESGARLVQISLGKVIQSENHSNF
jgi:hypothetical protein